MDQIRTGGGLGIPNCRVFWSSYVTSEEIIIYPIYTNTKLDNDFRYILLIFGCIKAGYKVNISHQIIPELVMVTSIGPFAVSA